MRSGEEAYHQYCTILSSAIQRTSMYAGSEDDQVETFFWWIFDFLSYLSEQERNCWWKFMSQRAICGSGVSFLPDIKQRFLSISGKQKNSSLEVAALAAEFGFLSKFLDYPVVNNHSIYDEFNSKLNQNKLVVLSQNDFGWDEIFSYCNLHIFDGSRAKNIACFFKPEKPWIYLDNLGDSYQLRSYPKVEK